MLIEVVAHYVTNIGTVLEAYGNVYRWFTNAT